MPELILSASIHNFNLSSLYNQNLFVDWNSPNSYLAIPIVTHLSLRTTAGNVTTGAHVFIDNKNNYTALHHAVRIKKNDTIVEYLLSCGANIKIKDDW